jgi:3-methyl-2-oxobutanoate hydroxymethyltransferase
MSIAQKPSRLFNVGDFRDYKKSGKKISMVAAYDFWSAQILDQSPIDCILVGDSCAMVMHGQSSTLQATVEMVAEHTRAVVKGAPNKFVVGDMPFPSFRKGPDEAMRAVDLFMKAGACVVKLEGVRGHESVIERIVGSGVPVMGHLGLTPQSIHQMGGYKVQGRELEAQDRLMQDALSLQNLGATSIVLECVPADLAAKLTKSLSIPTIGIGAGPQVDGQVLVLQDLLGLNTGFKPRFLRQYLNGAELISSALKAYDDSVKSGNFPNSSESY